jgi:transketolase
MTTGNAKNRRRNEKVSGREIVSMRDRFGKALVRLARANDRIVVLDGDVAPLTGTSLFAEEFPDRFVEVGIAEQNMVGIAAGLSCVGKIPFVTSFACFTTKRVYDQISLSVAYPRLNVKIMGCYSGIFTEKAGATHHSIEDISLMRSTPNMVVLIPADAIELERALDFAVEYSGPVYMRIPGGDYPLLLPPHHPFRLGEYPVLREGGDLSILTCGITASMALEAAEGLSEAGIEARVVNISTIKPANEGSILSHARETGAILTIETHSIIGGLGSLVSEILAENYPIPLLRIGIRDTFCESGSNKELCEKYGLSKEAIVSAGKKVLERKSGMRKGVTDSSEHEERVSSDTIDQKGGE